MKFITEKFIIKTFSYGEFFELTLRKDNIGT